MKTLREWLNELPEPYNKLAIANVISYRGEACLNDTESNMTHAINRFNWGVSPQGHDFWSPINDYYYHQERIPDIMRTMTNRMLEYYDRIEEIRNQPFPDCLATLERKRKEEEEKRIEEQRQLDERIWYSASFKEMLDKLEGSSVIALRLRKPFYTSNKEANYISMRGDMCSFLPAGREHKTNPDTGRWLRDGRQEMKPAKLARRLLIEDRNTDLDATDYEKFTNAVKSYISVLGDEDGNGKNITFKLVTGNEIARCYYYENYSKLMGTETNLWGSCMRSEDCQEYFSIYTNNPEVCSLLVAFDKDDKVLGRALVWTFKDGKRGMDTIYAHESLFESFINWAVENEAYYKDRQSCHHQQFDRFNRSRVDYNAYVQLKCHDVSYYPYMDTLSNLTYCGLLLTDPSGFDEYKILRDTGGGYEEHEDEDVVTTNDGYRYHRDECYYLDYRGPNGRREGYYHQDDCVRGHNGEIYHDDDVVMVGSEYYLSDDDEVYYVGTRDQYYLTDDVIEINGEVYHVDDCKELHDGEWAHEDDCVELHDGRYALSDDCVKCEYTDEYYLNDEVSAASDGSIISDDNLEDYEETIKEQLNQNENETAAA